MLQKTNDFFQNIVVLDEVDYDKQSYLEVRIIHILN